MPESAGLPNPPELFTTTRQMLAVAQMSVHRDLTAHLDVAGLELVHDHVGWGGQVLVVRDPVRDVRRQHREHAVDHLRGAWRPVDVELAGRQRGHPRGGDDVVQVAEVIAVQVREEHRIEHRRGCSSTRQAHEHTPPRVDEEVGPRRPDQARWPGAVGVGDGAARAEQGDAEIVHAGTVRSDS